MRLVFAGTPEAALPSLDVLSASRHEVVAVVTRPDAPSGRGRTLLASPVSRRARELGVQVLTPRRPSEPEFVERLRALAPDACPVVAYGALIPPVVLAVPPKGWVNLHFSLLPAWRGAAPVQHAILAGDQVTGAATFLLEQGLDTGPILGVLTEAIRPSDTSGELLARLAEAGAKLLLATLDALESGDGEPRPQSAQGVSLAPKLTAEDARIRWIEPALAVERRVRACTPAPGPWTEFRGERIKLAPVTLAEPDVEVVPGELQATRRQVLVGTGSQPVALGEVQPHGKRPMAAADWARGVRIQAGERFGGHLGDG